MGWAIFGILVSLVSFGVAAYFYYWVKSLDTAEGSISEVGNLIRKGAFTFLSGISHFIYFCCCSICLDAHIFP